MHDDEMAKHFSNDFSFLAFRVLSLSFPKCELAHTVYLIIRRNSIEFDTNYIALFGEPVGNCLRFAWRVFILLFLFFAPLFRCAFCFSCIFLFVVFHFPLDTLPIDAHADA